MCFAMLKMRWCGSFSSSFEVTLYSIANTTPSLPRSAIAVLQEKRAWANAGRRVLRWWCGVSGRALRRGGVRGDWYWYWEGYYDRW